jgi:hypothetical protein
VLKENLSAEVHADEEQHHSHKEGKMPYSDIQTVPVWHRIGKMALTIVKVVGVVALVWFVLYVSGEGIVPVSR